MSPAIRSPHSFSRMRAGDPPCRPDPERTQWARRRQPCAAVLLTAWGGDAVTVRLLTNIGRLWTGNEVLSNAAILVHNDRIAWVGRAPDLPQSVPGVVDDIVDVDHVENLGGALVTPGLIDAHTHPVYAGNRYAELAIRTGGSTSASITAAGGGVGSTVTVTRGTDPWTLCNGVRERLRDWLLSRHHDRRGQDRLPPHPRRRARRRAAPARAGEGADDAAGARHLPRGARGPAGILRPPARIRRGRGRLVRRRGGGRRRQRRRLLRRGPLHHRGVPLGARLGPQRRPAAAHPRRPVQPARRRSARRRARLRLRRRAAPHVRRGHRDHVPLRRARRGLPGHRAPERPPPARPPDDRSTACRSRSAATTTRATAASPRCRWSSRWPCRRSG